MHRFPSAEQGALEATGNQENNNKFNVLVVNWTPLSF
jgi:hypothetical protein